ncbi:MAG: VWA domain-containing protein [Synergistaceae bacterium]|jgi:stress response protein SCP2|nr:VWA domain-containing protein [Synergistaceae bacterium]
MTEIGRGFRGKIDDYFNSSDEIAISISVSGDGEYDSCCFGVDSADKLSDESYFVFFNQTASPNREIVLGGSGADTVYRVNLSRLPSHICKLVFTVSVDGNGVMGQIRTLTAKLSQGERALSLGLTGDSFHSEKAVIAVEIYRKDVWRVAAVANGFNGGLSALLKHFGGEEDLSGAPAAAPPPAEPKKVLLEKRLEREAPQLVSLVKPLKVALEKHKLSETVARVALVMDISGSMSERYGDGTVQEIVNKTVPLAVQFDDDGELDLWYYGSRPKRMPSINTGNYKEAVPADWKQLMKSLGYGNHEPAVIEQVVDEYRGGKLPAYALFITDGGVGNENSIKKLLIKASHEPIFWQFVGVGGFGYGVLERLDTMGGRYVDNANFFALDDFRRVDNTELYSRMLEEFPVWLSEIRRKGMI